MLVSGGVRVSGKKHWHPDHSQLIGSDPFLLMIEFMIVPKITFNKLHDNVKQIQNYTIALS